MRLLVVAAGLVLIGYGYAFHRTTLVVEQAPAAAEPDPFEQLDNWDEEEPATAEPNPFEELDNWDAEDMAAAPDFEPESAPAPAEEAVTVTEWGLVGAAAMGTIARLADGRLLLLRKTLEKAAPT